MSFTADLDAHPREADASGRKGPINLECYIRAAHRERALARNAAFKAFGRWLRGWFTTAPSPRRAAAGKV
jgi:hypothetical protein